MLAYPKQGKPARDKGYLKWIASNKCVVCKKWNETVVPNHCMKGTLRGMGMKASDYHTCPMCLLYHDAMHKNGNEIKYLASKGLPEGMILAKQYRNQYEQEKGVDYK